MSNTRLIKIAILLAPAVLLSCSSSKTRSIPQDGDQQESSSNSSQSNQESLLEIDYSLDRDRYRLSFKTFGNRTTIESYHDGKLVEKTEIDRERFSPFLKKAVQSMDTFRGELKTHAPCLNPFLVKLRVDGKLEQVSGCRSNDAGYLSKLIREGEFLLYSKRD